MLFIYKMPFSNFSARKLNCYKFNFYLCYTIITKFDVVYALRL